MRAPTSMRSFVSASCENAHRITSTVPSAAPPRIAAARRRRGTTANQNAEPMTSASSAPREYDSMIVVRRRPSAGQARALTAGGPWRRAPSHSSGGTAIAAVRPTAFQ